MMVAETLSSKDSQENVDANKWIVDTTDKDLFPGSGRVLVASRAEAMAYETNDLELKYQESIREADNLNKIATGPGSPEDRKSWEDAAVEQRYQAILAHEKKQAIYAEMQKAFDNQDQLAWDEAERAASDIKNSQPAAPRVEHLQPTTQVPKKRGVRGVVRKLFRRR